MDAPHIYSPEYYQRIADVEERHWWHVGMREIAATLIDGRERTAPRLRVLDAGCGTGTTLRWARTRLSAGSALGVDVSWDALTLCRRRAPGPVMQASVLELPFRADCFDLILCQDVLQHLPTDGGDGRALAEMFRILAPGGLLLLRSNSRVGAGPAAVPDEDFQQYMLSEVVSHCRAAGFVVCSATYANVLPAAVGWVRDLLRWMRRARRTEAHRYRGLHVRDTPSLHAWANRFLLMALRAEARYLAVSGRRLAFGHTTFCVGVKPRPSSGHPFGD